MKLQNRFCSARYKMELLMEMDDISVYTYDDVSISIKIKLISRVNHPYIPRNCENTEKLETRHFDVFRTFIVNRVTSHFRNNLTRNNARWNYTARGEISKFLEPLIPRNLSLVFRQFSPREKKGKKIERYIRKVCWIQKSLVQAMTWRHAWY